jgi:hypothetical protein
MAHAFWNMALAGGATFASIVNTDRNNQADREATNFLIGLCTICFVAGACLSGTETPPVSTLTRSITADGSPLAWAPAVLFAVSLLSSGSITAPVSAGLLGALAVKWLKSS